MSEELIKHGEENLNFWKDVSENIASFQHKVFNQNKKLCDDQICVRIYKNKLKTKERRKPVLNAKPAKKVCSSEVKPLSSFSGNETLCKDHLDQRQFKCNVNGFKLRPFKVVLYDFKTNKADPRNSSEVKLLSSSSQNETLCKDRLDQRHLIKCDANSFKLRPVKVVLDDFKTNKVDLGNLIETKPLTNNKSPNVISKSHLVENHFNNFVINLKIENNICKCSNKRQLNKNCLKIPETSGCLKTERNLCKCSNKSQLNKKRLKTPETSECMKTSLLCQRGLFSQDKRNKLLLKPVVKLHRIEDSVAFFSQLNLRPVWKNIVLFKSPEKLVRLSKFRAGKS